MRYCMSIAASLALLAAPTAVVAQAWETPSFLPPRPGNNVGLALVSGHGYNLGLAGLWRSDNLSVRFDLYDTSLGSRLGLGAETHAPVLHVGPSFPLDVSWTAAAGVIVGSGLTSLWVPVGVTLGRTFHLQQISVQPYVYPRLGLSLGRFRDAAGNTATTTNLNAVLELGSDVYMNARWTVGVAFDIGDYAALGISAAYHLSRSLSIR